MQIATDLIGLRATVDARDMEQYRTPLMMAAGTGHTDVVQFLIRRGANLWLTDSNGKSAPDKSMRVSGDVKRALMAADRNLRMSDRRDWQTTSYKQGSGSAQHRQFAWATWNQNPAAGQGGPAARDTRDWRDHSW